MKQIRGTSGTATARAAKKALVAVAATVTLGMVIVLVWNMSIQ